jgi:hypothetical protein
MGKRPAFLFYTGDWMKDPELRAVSSGARGLWIDMLCLMFESARKGYLQLNSGKIVNAENLARMTGNSTDDTSRWLQELEDSGVFSRNQQGVIYCRRMLSDEAKHAKDRDRQYKFRHGGIARSSQHVAGSESIADSQPRLFAEDADGGGAIHDVNEIGHLHPANDHLKHKPLPPEQREAIVEAIARDGRELVLSGTTTLAKKVASWPESELRFIPNPVRFFREGEYLKRRWQGTVTAQGSARCTLHPQAGFTDWGECWGCYGNKYVSGCQPA